MTDAATVRDVAALARLAISDQDIENATAEFNQTLALFDALSSADTTNVAPMINPLDSAQRLRTDRIETLVDRAGLMQNAPASEEDYFLVPRVSTDARTVRDDFLAGKQLDAGHVSSRELVEDAIARTETLNQNLTPLLLWISPALWRRQKADKARAAGATSPLLGVPMLHKDIFCTRGVQTSCASKMLADFVPPYDATVVKKLDDAGMVSLGKCNMDEFAMGSSNETSFFGAVKIHGILIGSPVDLLAVRPRPLLPAWHRWQQGQIPAVRFVSLRRLWHYGLKPTYGRVSRYGMIAFASSMDQAGPMARTAEDCALVLNAMAGHDPLDSTCADIAVPDYSAGLEKSIEGLRVGIPKEFFSSHLNDGVAATVSAAIKELEAAGAVIVDVSLPSTDLGVSTYYVIAPAEASANLSRYDGVRYGYRCDSPSDLQDLYCDRALRDLVKRSNGEF